MASTISAGTTAGSAIAFAGDTSGELQLRTNGTTPAMTITTGQNVCVGTTTALYTDANRRTITINGPTSSLIGFGSGGNANGYLYSDSSQFNLISEGTRTLTFGTLGAGATRFLTNNTESVRIDTSGNLLIGTSNGTSKLVVINPSGGSWTTHVLNSSTTGQALLNLTEFSGRTPNDATSLFYYGGDTTAARFIVYSNGGIANYQANNFNLSDVREKTNIQLAGNYLDKICSIPVKTFNYIDQNLKDDDGLTLGVIAQDVQAVAPELIAESDWAKQGEEPKMRLSIYQTDLQYALMKSIQELKTQLDEVKAELDATKAEVQALKGVA